MAHELEDGPSHNPFPLQKKHRGKQIKYKVTTGHLKFEFFLLEEA